MHPVILVLLLVLPVDPPATSAPGSSARATAKKKPSPAEEFHTISQEFDAQQQRFVQMLRTAKTPAERSQANRNRPNTSRYTGRMLTLARNHPHDPAAVDALVWVVQHGSGTSDSRRAQDILLRDHLADPKLAEICTALASSRDADADKTLRQLLEKSPNEAVQGQAAFALAHRYQRRAERIGTFNRAEVERLNKEAETLYERVVSDYPNVNAQGQTLGKAAQEALFVLRHLAVGKEAPDIEGQDIEGKRFKLSDYRGKVVLLDFWGNW